MFIAALGTIDVEALASGSGDGWLHPAAYVALVAIGVSFFSATQDIVIDAYRRESLSDAAQAGGAAVYVTGYRVAMLLASGGGLVLADYLDFPLTYLCLASCMVIGMATTIFAPEPVPDDPPPTTLRAAVVEPFSAFFSRRGAIAILIFIVLYKLGDTMAGHLTTPFYLDVGFSKSEIGLIVKAFGFWPTIFGGLLAGAIWAWLGVYRGLMFFGILQGLSTFGFAVLSEVGYDRALLAGVVGFENLTAGMGTTAYLAFMALLTDRRFTATQFALLTSLMGQARVVMTAPTGFLAEAMGWTPYFVMCGLIAIPGLMLLYSFKPWLTESEEKVGDSVVNGRVFADIEGLSVTAADREFLAHPLIAGITLFARNYESPGQLLSLTNELKAIARPDPLLIAVDQEGGRVQRFSVGSLVCRARPKSVKPMRVMKRPG